MTPQQLMDMPAYGAAEKWLRENGKWKLTAYELLSEASYQEYLSNHAYDLIDSAMEALCDETDN